MQVQHIKHANDKLQRLEVLEAFLEKSKLSDQKFCTARFMLNSTHVGLDVLVEFTPKQTRKILESQINDVKSELREMGVEI